MEAKFSASAGCRLRGWGAKGLQRKREEGREGGVGRGEEKEQIADMNTEPRNCHRRRHGNTISAPHGRGTCAISVTGTIKAAAKKGAAWSRNFIPSVPACCCHCCCCRWRLPPRRSRRGRRAADATARTAAGECRPGQESRGKGGSKSH